MASSVPSVVTLKDVAARAGVSLAAASYALRHHPKISAATAKRVRAVASALGYRPNPRVASLMAHIRGAQRRLPAERMAFVWVHTTRSATLSDPFFRLVFEGARRRAEQAGFLLEEFWTNEDGISDRRLQGVLIARGITGVVLSPVLTAEPSLSLDWDWSQFATAVIGNVAWTPELHHAGHHHYLAMRAVLVELTKLGYTRPAAIIDQATNERAKHAWEGAFLANHPMPGRARSMLRVVDPSAQPDVKEWLRSSAADALILSRHDLAKVAISRATLRRLRMPVCTLYWSENLPRGVGGIDQSYDRIAAHAVDLVVSQLNNNERGPPDLPSMMLFPGRWVAPKVLR